MIITDLFESHQPCPECGGPSFSDLILAEKKDACYYKVKASAKVWPSAYASGRLVQCRKKGASNYGNKSEGRLNEFAPAGSSDGDSGRWYTDDELADIIGDDWFEDFDVSHDEFNIDEYGEKAKQNLVGYANTWFDDKGYNVNVLGVEHNDVDHDLQWYIVGSFHNPGFANEGMAEGMERAVDDEGRTQAQWVQLVKSKFPGAKITQAKMIDGPMQATLPDGRKIAWSKVEQIDEIIDPSTALAKALRYIGRKFATAFPWLAVGGAGAGLAATGLMAPIVASMGGISTALSALSAEMAFTAGMAGTYAAPSIIQTIKDLFAADENSIQTGIKRWVEKYVGDDNDVQEFMLTHAKAAYEGKPGFRWRAKEWPVKLSHNEAEAFLEKNDKSWLDYEKQKKAEAEKAKIDAEKAKIDAGKTDMDSAKEQGVAEDQVNEKSVSQAQFRTMAAAAHNPEFAKKVGIKQSVAKEFNRADKGSNYKKLPDRTTEGEIEKTKTGIVHHSSGAYGGGEAPRAPYDPGKYAKDIDHLDKNLTAKLDKSMGIKWPHGNKKSDIGEGEQQKGADYRDPPEADYGDDYQDMVSRVKKLAGLGPLKTVYDPARRVYRNVPTAVQPKK